LESLHLPFSNLLNRVFLPFFVLILDRKPCFLFLFNRELRFIVFRGPQRTCAAKKAGWHEMDVCGTRSRAPAALVVVWSGVKATGREIAAVLGRREGRMLGREEKSLMKNWRRWLVFPKSFCLSHCRGPLVSAYAR